MTRKDFYIALGERLRSIRHFNNESWHNVADALGIDPNLYGDYESGKNHPDLWRLMQLAKHWGVPITTLIPPIYEEKK